MEMPNTRINITPHHLIPAHLISEVESKLAYVDETITKAVVQPAGDQITLDLNSPANQADREHLVRKIQQVVDTMAKGGFEPKIQILEDYLNRPVTFHEDPTLQLIERNEINQEANGIYSLGPLVTELVDYFETRFLELAQSFDAKPYRFPTLIPAKYLERVNYFRAFPHSLSFATHLREDLDVIDDFAEHTSCDEHGALTAEKDSFASIKTLLSPAVCYHLYFANADRTLPDGQITATAVGSCFRYESINLSSLERLWDFTMREVIFVGGKEFVLSSREKAREVVRRIFEEFGLAYKVESANDPFFIGEFRKQAAFQSAFQLKYEIRASLPYKSSTLAVGSFNYHQDFFGRHLNISLPDGSLAHTGCVAFGLERMAFAFLAQFGIDTKNWPTTVRSALS
jgi:seryl-tRNA synthetase